MTQPQDWSKESAVSSFEEAVANNRLIGYSDDDPFVGSLTWLLAILDTPLSERRIFEAVPHAPQVLAVEDIQNTLRNLGVTSHVVRASHRAWKSADGPHLALDHAGRPFVRPQSGARPLHPLTGIPGPRFRRSYAYLLVPAKDDQVPSGSWVGQQLRFLRRDILRLFWTKLMLACISLAIALGVIAVYQWVLPTQAYGTLVALAVGLFAVLASDYAFRILKARFMGEIAERAEYALATSLLERVLGMPLERVAAATPAQQSARLRQLISASSTFAGPALDVVLDLPFAVLLLCGVALVAPPLALVPFALAGVLTTLILVALPELRRREAAASAARATLSRLIDEAVRDKAQIQADGREALVLKRGTQAARTAAIQAQRHEALQRMLEAVAAASGPLAGGLLAVVGAWLVMNGTIGVGVLLAVVILSWRILSPIQSASQVALRLAEMFERRRAINAMMDLQAERDPPDTALTRVNGRSLATDGLVCRYPGADEPALRGVSVSIPQGALVAVTGSSGAGKTTLLRALSGLAPARGGRVLVGGLNAVQIPTTTLRRSVAFVPARPHILHGTISQNLRLSRPDASDDLLREVCDDLGILETVESLPAGFDTRITTHSADGLPSGFLQSLAIARVILDAPDAVLLDEPAVNLDDRLEKALLQTLERGRGRHTVLMVTHRPSHTRFCDLELRLQRGQVQRFDRPEETAA